jgi:azurin
MNILNNINKKSLLIAILFSTVQVVNAQSIADIIKKESVYYKIVDVPIPTNISLEVGGLALTDDDKLGVSTRRGEIWLIDKPYSLNPSYNRYAHGLHESLGLAYKDKGFYLSQRAELTRLEDKNGDGKADLYKTIYSWPLSGNYHEYSYGPKFLSNGDMLVTLNLGWEGRGASLVKWRGWMLKITPQGVMTPVATGLRSPAGFVVNDKDAAFYTDNQGDWVGSGRMTHLESGDFAGNTAGLLWTNDSKSPLKLKPQDVAIKSGLSIYEYAKKIPEIKPPAIWFPHTILGISTSDILINTTAGKFGPFDGQWFVGDQGHSKIMRVFMEKVNGVYQGAAFPFVEGFSSGILRMIWGSDKSMFVGMTSRGWGSTGKEEFGLQRLVWTGKIPFEIKTIKAQNDGFLVEFTKPVNKQLAAQTSSYSVTTFNYNYHSNYGSDIVDQQAAMIHSAKVSEDGLSAKLTISGMKLGFIHQLKAEGVQSQMGESLLHNTGYYTLNQVPGGVLKVADMHSMSNSGKMSNQPKRTNLMPINWANGPDKKFVVGTVPGIKFDFKEIVVAPNARVQITFDNNDDMLHNLVILQPGADNPDKVGQMAMELGLNGADMNYVPKSDLVLFHTGIIQPEKSESIYFNAPRAIGEYWILCTFPGHSYTMRAKLIVK